VGAVLDDPDTLVVDFDVPVARAQGVYTRNTVNVQPGLLVRAALLCGFGFV
jgi:hypothetical protein